VSEVKKEESTLAVMKRILMKLEEIETNLEKVKELLNITKKELEDGDE
jgi:hypothetical protein